MDEPGAVAAKHRCDEHAGGDPAQHATPRFHQRGRPVGALDIPWRGHDTAGYGPDDYSFQTPVGAAADQQCGRAVFDDFHVENAASGGTTFPAECPAGAMTAQEKMLEYMIFDLASCVVVPPPPTPACTSLTCPQQGFNCGAAGDGCGNLLNCGSCSAPQTCGGGGQPGVCGNR